MLLCQVSMLDDSPGPAEQLENTKAASDEAAFLIWCPETESNRRHGDFQSPALPTELSGQRGAIKRLLPGHVKPLLCRWSFAGRHIAFGALEFFAGKVLFHFTHDVFAVLGIHHVQVAFVDDHGLVVLPFIPGFLRDILVDVLATAAGEGRLGQAGQFFFMQATHYGTAHQMLLGWAWLRKSFFTGAARPIVGGCSLLYQTCRMVVTSATPVTCA